MEQTLAVLGSKGRIGRVQVVGQNSVLKVHHAFIEQFLQLGVEVQELQATGWYGTFERGNRWGRNKECKEISEAQPRVCGPQTWMQHFLRCRGDALELSSDINCVSVGACRWGIVLGAGGWWFFGGIMASGRRVG